MEIKNLHFSYYDDKPILNDISLTIKNGAITTLMGANGCGKSTLLKLMSKNLAPQSGDILINNKNITEYPLKKFAKEVAIVHQKNSAPDDLTVQKLVAYGRIPYTNLLKSGSQEGHDKVQWAMEVTGVKKLANRTVGTLSGGQRQRAFIAMALAQDTKILFLDEPTTFLDVRYQVEILRLVQRLNRDLGITIVMVLHDINQALAYSDEIIGLKGGKICVQGNPKQVITAEVIEQIYDIKLEVFERNQTLCVMTI